jgi:NhaP-type Na+/H+ or K+/H+ antiporter
MAPYITVITIAGIIILVTAWLPTLARRLPFSLPMMSVGIGAAVFSFAEFAALELHPIKYPELTERFTEFVVLISLMGAGLRIDTQFSSESWRGAGRLLFLAMPLTIFALAAFGYSLLGLGLASALLLGAALAPTDPVLATDVQVGPPRQGDEDHVRFTLTTEAGLNDGLAFPFVNLALALALNAGSPEAWFTNWFLVDVLWKLGAGAAIGWLAGELLGWLIFNMPGRALSQSQDGFVALGVTLVAYGLAELAYAYGFIAVFVTALRVRATERNHEYHDKMHEFIDQLERLLTMMLLVLFGGAIVGGGLLRAVTWEAVAFALVAIFLVRPLSAWISLASIGRRDERAAISFFGIRGIGSAYYLAYGFNHGAFERFDVLWSVVSLIILMSIVIHGVTATVAMEYVDRRSRRDEAQRAA